MELRFHHLTSLLAWAVALFVLMAPSQGTERAFSDSLLLFLGGLLTLIWAALTQVPRGQVWMAGEWVMTPGGCYTWEVLGVFLTEEEAAAACRNTDCFVGPIRIGVRKMMPKNDWPGSYFPHEREKKRD